uniref:Uncharacterized protein n=1 Tax=uncultured alpha proteobacterium EB000_37G09 TaxID=710792 RepID=E0XZG9_9PROT|nr:hypothetical protein [uncultured alpha proteobacterium EB000_37G09]
MQWLHRPCFIPPAICECVKPVNITLVDGASRCLWGCHYYSFLFVLWPVFLLQVFPVRSKRCRSGLIYCVRRHSGLHMPCFVLAMTIDQLE